MTKRYVYRCCGKPRNCFASSRSQLGFGIKIEDGKIHSLHCRTTFYSWFINTTIFQQIKLRTCNSSDWSHEQRSHMIITWVAYCTPEKHDHLFLIPGSAIGRLVTDIEVDTKHRHHVDTSISLHRYHLATVTRIHREHYRYVHEASLDALVARNK